MSHDDEDVQWRERSSGDGWRRMRPSLENPMTWSIPAGRIARIGVRVHVVFILYILVELGRARFADQADASPRSVGLVAIQLGCLFGLVLLHELGHCLACRRVGGEADEILMWPLGGLAYCEPPHRWRAHFMTVAGGPLVNVAILAILAPVLGGLTGEWWGTVLPNPWHYPTFLGLDGLAGRTPMWFQVLYALHFVNFVLLLFNLLPIFPLDGGRLVQSLAWSRIGYARATTLAVYVGYFGAIALGLVGAVTGTWMLVAIAVFGGVECYLTLKRLQWTESELAVLGDEWKRAPEPERGPSWTEKRADRRRQRDASRSAETEQEVDRILEKIQREGMSSLSGRERRFLRQATAERQRSGRDG